MQQTRQPRIQIYWALTWERARRRKTLFGETSNTTREDAYAPQTPPRSPHAVKGVPPEAINTRSREIVSKAFI